MRKRSEMIDVRSVVSISLAEQDGAVEYTTLEKPLVNGKRHIIRCDLLVVFAFAGVVIDRVVEIELELAARVVAVDDDTDVLIVTLFWFVTELVELPTIIMRGRNH